ncbi:MAG: thioredoxin family protein [Candidatus Micrarchaeota archaeon]
MKTGEMVVAAAAALIVILVIVGYLAMQAGEGAYFDDASPVMYFHSANCHFCQEQKPILQELAAQGYRVKSMDVGIHPEYWKQYSIEGTPTFLAANGDSKVGLTERTELEAWLASHGARIK